jgi:hypothetical protein
MPLKAAECLAVLTQEFGVRVLNVSAGGCLVETERRMQVGLLGRLRLQLGSEEYVDDVEVMRVENAGETFHVGMRFLRTRPHMRSIRHAVECHVAELYASLDDARVM